MTFKNWSALTAACFADVSLERLGGSLFHPWGMSLLNENQVLVIERRGKIFRINLTDGSYKIGNVPKTVSKEQGGVLDILVYAKGQSDPVVSFCYSSLTDQGATTAINRAGLKNDLLEQQDVIFIANNSSWRDVHFGCRLAIVGDELYVSFGDAVTGMPHRRDNHTPGQLFGST